MRYDELNFFVWLGPGCLTIDMVRGCFGLGRPGQRPRFKETTVFLRVFVEVWDVTIGSRQFICL